MEREAWLQAVHTIKPSHFGIKLFVLCHSKSDTVLDFIVYTGKGTQYIGTTSDSGASAKVIETLLQPYLNRGHVLCIDNWI